MKVHDIKAHVSNRNGKKNTPWLIVVVLFTLSSFVLNCSEETPPDYLGAATIDQRTVSLASSVGGTVVRVALREGQLVKRDDLCAVIDTVPHSLSLREAKAKLSELSQSIAAAGSEIEVLKAQMRGLAREYGRIGDLADKGAVPAREKENLGTEVQAADLEIEAAKHALAGLRNRKKALEAEIDRLKHQLNECYVYAPVSGRIVARYVSPGEISSPNSPIFKIAVLDTVMVRIAIPASRMAAVRYDSPVYVRYTDAEGISTSVKASVSIIENKPVPFPAGKTPELVSVGAWIPNSNGILLPGLPVEVWLTPEPSQ